MTDVPTTDNVAEGRIEIVIDNLTAELVYEIDRGRLVIVHTGVPDDLGGRGIGGKLVSAAVDKAIAGNLTVVPRCPFASAWLKKHPEVAAQVPIHWSGDL